MEFRGTPAYGRDYKSKDAVLTDWNAGRDFILQPSGQYFSKRDADPTSAQVWIRYDKMRKLVRVK